MVKRIGSTRRKSRNIFTKSHKRKGKISISRYFQAFEIGDNVTLHLEPAVQKGIYHSRFFGRNGKITGKKGKCYTVEIFDRSKRKELIVHPVHILSLER